MRLFSRGRFIKRGRQKPAMIDRVIFAGIMVLTIIAVVYFLSK